MGSFKFDFADISLIVELLSEKNRYYDSYKY